MQEYLFFSGTLNIHEMRDLHNRRIDEIKFISLSIRNKGTINMFSEHQQFLNGLIMQIFPGGLLTAKNLRVDVEQLTIDVMAEVNANYLGYCDMGL